MLAGLDNVKYVRMKWVGHNVDFFLIFNVISCSLFQSTAFANGEETC